MRLFIAVHFSDEVRGLLAETIGRLRAQVLSGNFTRPENLHLTLAFIGETHNITAVRQVMDRITAAPFVITVGGFGHFGTLYWAGADNTAPLRSLAESLQNALRGAGFPIEQRRFQPHITLARNVVTKGPFDIGIPGTHMTVSRVSLMKSERQHGKLTYSEIYGKVLSGKSISEKGAESSDVRSHPAFKPESRSKAQ